MTGKKGKVTSPKVAKKASDLLKDKKQSKKVKSVAGSDLSQSVGKKKGKKK